MGQRSRIAQESEIGSFRGRRAGAVPRPVRIAVLRNAAALVLLVALAGVLPSLFGHGSFSDLAREGVAFARAAGERAREALGGAFQGIPVR